MIINCGFRQMLNQNGIYHESAMGFVAKIVFFCEECAKIVLCTSIGSGNIRAYDHQ